MSPTVLVQNSPWLLRYPTPSPRSSSVRPSRWAVHLARDSPRRRSVSSRSNSGQTGSGGGSFRRRASQSSSAEAMCASQRTPRADRVCRSEASVSSLAQCPQRKSRRCRARSVIRHAGSGHGGSRRAQVAPHTRETGARQRGLAEAASELHLIHALEHLGIAAAERPARLESGLGGRRGEALIPGADLVADVATED